MPSRGVREKGGYMLVGFAIMVTTVVILAMVYSLVIRLTGNQGKKDSHKVKDAQTKLQLTKLRGLQVIEDARLDDLEHQRFQAAAKRVEDAEYAIEPVRKPQLNTGRITYNTGCVCGHSYKEHDATNCLHMNQKYRDYGFEDEQCKCKGFVPVEVNLADA